MPSARSRSYVRKRQNGLRDEDCRACNAIGGKVGECGIGLVEPVGNAADTQPVFAGETKELSAVVSGVGGDAANLSLVEQVSLVVQGRDVAEVDARDRQSAAPVERGERRWDQVTDGCEQDRRIQRFRRRIGRVAGGGGAQ